MEKERPRVAVSIFAQRGNRVLLGKRRGSAGDGQWALPGGHVEFEESLLEAAKRELKEETDLDAEFEFACVVSDHETTDEDGRHYVHVGFRAKNFEGDPKLMEPDACSGWQWFNIDDLPENIFYGNKKVIPAFLENKTFVD